MINIDELRVQEHPFKKILKKHKISIAMTARYLNLSYPYVCNMLNGTFRMSAEAAQKLQALVGQLEGVS